MTAKEQQPYERMRYWQGQMLRTRDFNDHLAFAREKRWWHNRAVHNAYGVVYGFHVQLLDATVKVEPGLAYDCYGRELLLQRVRRIDLPHRTATQQNWSLLAQYNPTLRSNSNRCHPFDCTAKREEAVLTWKRTKQVAISDGVELAQFVVDASTQEITEVLPVWKVGLFQRLASRPVARPFIGYGATVQGNTPWEYKQIPNYVHLPWSTPAAPISLHVVEVTVDTSPAGFQDTPCYSPMLNGQVSTQLPEGRVLRWFSRVTDATPTSFTYSCTLLLIESVVATQPPGFSLFVAMPQNGSDLDYLASYARRELYLSWIGVEMGRADSFTSEVTYGYS